MIPTVRDRDAERSRHASRVCHHAHLSLVEDRPHCTLSFHSYKNVLNRGRTHFNILKLCNKLIANNRMRNLYGESIGL